MSPWWLRPPGDGDETAGDPRETADAAERDDNPSDGPASIADVLDPDAAPERDSRPQDADGDAAPDNAAGDDTGGDDADEDEAPRRRRRRPRRRRKSASATNGDDSNRRSNAAADDDDEDDDEDDYESLAREILGSLPVAGSSRPQSEPEERKIAIFCDLENIALGVRDSEVKRFDIHLVLERLLEKGKIIVKRAYADWERYSEFKIAFHEAAIELIDIPQRRYTGKNSADIKMVVDAMDLSYSKEHLDTFVVLSGDSDFSPLVSKLKENNKYVIGIGVKNSSSNLLIDNCDEFLYYEDVWRDRVKGPELTGLTKKKAEVFTLLIDSVLALQRENKDVFWGSLIKQTMQRKKPSFNEGYYGYSTFTELLQDAERHQIVKLKKDQRSGTVVVSGFAKRK